MMPATRNKIILFLSLALMAGSMVFRWSRKHAPGSEGVGVAPPPAEAVVEAANTHSTPVGKRPVRARKLANAQAREKLLAAIRQTSKDRKADPSRPTSRGDQAGDEATSTTVSAEEKAYIFDAVSAIRPLLGECYGQLLERTEASGKEASGTSTSNTVVVQFTIEGDPDVGGVIGSSEIEDEGTTIEDADFLECVRETMYGIEIDPPRSGGTVMTIVPFEFRPSVTP